MSSTSAHDSGKRRDWLNPGLLANQTITDGLLHTPPGVERAPAPVFQVVPTCARPHHITLVLRLGEYSVDCGNSSVSESRRAPTMAGPLNVYVTHCNALFHGGVTPANK